MVTTLEQQTALTGFSREAVEALSRAKNEPTWLRDWRLAAWETYERLPMPARTDEEWRRTDFRALKFDRLAPFAGVGERAPALDGLLASVGDGGISDQSARAGVNVQRDGSDLYTEISDDARAQGAIYCDLDTAVREHPELIRQHFMTDAVPVDFGKFEALHAALWQGGTFLYVPKNVAIELPFRAFTIGKAPAAALFTHTLVVLEENAEAFVVDAFNSETLTGQAMASGVVELILGRSAKLRYVQVQDWGRHVWNFMTERAVLAKDATLNSLHVTLGSKWTKNSIGSHLKGENTLAEMLGIFFADSDQFFDHHTWQLHESPYATSDLEFKGALRDNARSVYSGLIKVWEGAHKTDAYQQNRNLVLSPEARADSIPTLEIGANDVRCTHGATVSQVVPEHIFYLQARGIPYTEAQKLIVEGFFRPVIDRIPVEEIQGFLESAIARKVGL
jgi:Fe-S cluster assembly protein SufD